MCIGVVRRQLQHGPKFLRGVRQSLGFEVGVGQTTNEEGILAMRQFAGPLGPRTAWTVGTFSLGTWQRSTPGFPTPRDDLARVAMPRDLFDPFRHMAADGQEQAQVIVGHGVARLRANGLAIALDRFGRPAFGGDRLRQYGGGFLKVPGVKTDRLAEQRLRLRVSPLLQKRIAQQVVRLCVVGCHGDGVAEERFAIGPVSQLPAGQQRAGEQDSSGCRRNRFAGVRPAVARSPTPQVAAMNTPIKGIYV